MPSDYSPLQARKLLERHGIKARKSLGQHFLTSAGAREVILASADLQPEDVVLEIGPGLGALTERLVEQAARVVSIELDTSLFQHLSERLGRVSNLMLVQGDMLDYSPDDLNMEPGYVVVANIPYNITSAVIRHLMESELPARRVVLTLQKEVAERIVSEPGDMNLLALSVQVYGHASVDAVISAGSFYPVPSVESAVLRVDMHTNRRYEKGLMDVFFKLARAGFAQKRKQLKNALAHGLPLDKARAEALLVSCGVEPRRRAQALDVETWFCLAEAYDRFAGS